MSVRYHEDRTVHALMGATADRYGLSFAEVQRMVNRAGIQALQLAEA